MRCGACRANGGRRDWQTPIAAKLNRSKVSDIWNPKSNKTKKKTVLATAGGGLT